MSPYVIIAIIAIAGLVIFLVTRGKKSKPSPSPRPPVGPVPWNRPNPRIQTLLSDHQDSVVI